MVSTNSSATLQTVSSEVNVINEYPAVGMVVWNCEAVKLAPAMFQSNTLSVIIDESKVLRNEMVTVRVGSH